MTAHKTTSGRELEELWTLKKHYDARLPENVRLVPVPKSLSREHVQNWLVDNIIKSEKTFIAGYNDKERSAHDLGASAWRKAFWKRIVQQIEGEIAFDKDDDKEVHEDILFCLSDLMASPTGGGDGTFLRRFHYEVSNQIKTVVTREDEASISGGTTGLRSWPAALHLANHLIYQKELVMDKAVLELGSGAGLVAALVSQLQQTSSGPVIATDFHDAVLDRLEENIQYNYVASNADSLNRAQTSKLDWSKPKELDIDAKLDLIIASDVVYDPELAPLLAACLALLMREHDDCKTLLSQTIRNESTWETFLSSCVFNQLQVDEIDDRVGVSDEVMVTGRKPEDVIKLFWIVPVTKS